MLKISLTVFDKIKLKKIASNYTIVKKKDWVFSSLNWMIIPLGIKKDVV